jgi:glucokinase
VYLTIHYSLFTCPRSAGAIDCSLQGDFVRIGIDIGGTKIIAGIVDEEGSVTYSKRILTETAKGYEGIRKDIIILIDDITHGAGVEKRNIEQIGIATAGQIEKGSNRILFSPNLGWHNVPLRDDIEKATGVKTHIENDVNAATYGEWKFGFGCVPKDVLGVFIGTGIGGGLVLDGKLYRGFSNVGAEVGHTILNPFGYRCSCGNNGCFEAYCGGWYITERVKKKIREGYKGIIGDIINGDMMNLHAGTIEEAYSLGDECCVSVWREVIEYLGTGIASLVNLLNPEIIVLGGGVIYGTKHLIDDMKVVLNKRAMRDSLKDLRIEKAKLGEESALLGVSYIDE